jgi:hypothetical protein
MALKKKLKPTKELVIPKVRVDSSSYSQIAIFGQGPWDKSEVRIGSFSSSPYPSCCGAKLLTNFTTNWTSSAFNKSQAADHFLTYLKPSDNHKEEEEIYISMLADGIKQAIEANWITAGCTTGTFASRGYRGGDKKAFDKAEPYYNYFYEAFMRAGFKELCTFVNPVHMSKIWMIGYFSTKPEFATIGDTTPVVAEKGAE